MSTESETARRCIDILDRNMAKMARAEANRRRLQAEMRAAIRASGGVRPLPPKHVGAAWWLTQAERLEIRRLYRNGHNLSRISEIMHRGHKTIRAALGSECPPPQNHKQGRRQK